MATPVRLDRDGGLAVLTIDSPPLNLYTAELQDELGKAIGELETTPPRAVLIRAEGKIVSGGVDVSLFDAQGSAADAKALFDRMLAIPDRIAAALFDTEDLRGAVKSFLADGPGKATFTGR